MSNHVTGVSIDTLLRIAHVRWGGASVPMTFSFLDLLSFEAGGDADLMLATDSGEFISTSAAPNRATSSFATLPGERAKLYASGSNAALAKIREVLTQLEPEVGRLLAKGAESLGRETPPCVDVRFDHDVAVDELVQDVWDSVAKRLGRSVAPVGLRWQAIFRYPVDATWCGFGLPAADRIPDEDVRGLQSLLARVFTTGLVQIARYSDRTFVAIPFSFWGVAAWLSVLFEVVSADDLSSEERARIELEQLGTIRIWYSSSPFSTIREYLPHLFANSLFRELANVISGHVPPDEAWKRFRSIVVAFPELRRDSRDDPFAGLAKATGIDIGGALTQAGVWSQTGRLLPGSSEEAWNAETRTTFERELLKPADLFSQAIADKISLQAELRGAADMSYELAHEIGQVISPLLPGPYSPIVRSWNEMREALSLSELESILGVDGYVIPFGSIYKGAVHYLDLISQSSRGSKIVVAGWTSGNLKEFFARAVKDVIAGAAFAVHERGTSAKPRSLEDTLAINTRANEFRDAIIQQTFLDASLEEMQWPTTETRDRTRLAQLFAVALLNAANHSSSRQSDSSWKVSPIVVRFDSQTRHVAIASVSFSDGGSVSVDYGTFKVLRSLSQRINASSDVLTFVDMKDGLPNDLPVPSRDHLASDRIFVTTIQFDARTPARPE